MFTGAGARIIGNPAAVQAAGWQHYNWLPRTRIITPPTPLLSPVAMFIVALETNVESEPVVDMVKTLRDLGHPVADITIGAIVVVVILATWRMIVRFVELRTHRDLHVE